MHLRDASIDDVLAEFHRRGREVIMIAYDRLPSGEADIVLKTTDGMSKERLKTGLMVMTAYHYPELEGALVASGSVAKKRFSDARRHANRIAQTKKVSDAARRRTRVVPCLSIRVEGTVNECHADATLDAVFECATARGWKGENSNYIWQEATFADDAEKCIATYVFFERSDD